jgi:hypothetical protein
MLTLFKPALFRLGLAVAALGLLAAGVWLIEKRAAERTLQRVERANTEAARRADEGEQRVLTCPPELWSRELRQCATKLH